VHDLNIYELIEYGVLDSTTKEICFTLEYKALAGNKVLMKLVEQFYSELRGMDHRVYWKAIVT
jgi:hypothetical protein